MDHKAALLALVLVSGSLAGCTGDPDGGGNDEFDAETLQGMIEDGLQDFMNNTTVEITNNYYTNETSYNTNNVNGSGGFGYASMMHMFTISWSPGLSYDIMNHTIDFQDSSVIGNITNLSNANVSSGADQGTGQWWIDKLSYWYNGQVIQITPTCWEAAFAHYNNYYSGEQYWSEYVANTYGYNSSGELDQLGHEIHNDVDDLWYSSWFDQCEASNNSLTSLFEINISPGEVIKLLSAPGGIVWSLDCEDGYSGSIGTYIGGQSQCILSGTANSYWGWSSTYVTGEWLGGLNGYHYDPIPIESHSVAEQFSIYYEIYPAIVDE